MPEAVSTALLSMGLPGLGLLAMGWWILRQDATIATLRGRIDEVQEKRVTDAQKMAAEAVNLGEALDRQSAILTEIKAQGGK